MIDKKEAIRFLIEECYKKFPQLMQEFTDEEMYRILDENISKIEVDGKSEVNAGYYSPISRKIHILNKENINLENVMKDQNLVGILAHEGMHALLRKSARRTRN